MHGCCGPVECRGIVMVVRGSPGRAGRTLLDHNVFCTSMPTSCGDSRRSEVPAALARRQRRIADDRQAIGHHCRCCNLPGSQALRDARRGKVVDQGLHKSVAGRQLEGGLPCGSRMNRHHAMKHGPPCGKQCHTNIGQVYSRARRRGLTHVSCGVKSRTGGANELTRRPPPLRRQACNCLRGSG